MTEDGIEIFENDKTLSLGFQRQAHETFDDLYELSNDLSPRESRDLARILEGDDFISGRLQFSLHDGGPSIHQIQSDFPQLSLIGRSGNSYMASLPNKQHELDRFLNLYGDLPQPTPNETRALNDIFRSKS